MSDSFPDVDDGERWVARCRASGLTRREFAEQTNISASTPGSCMRRERKASLSAALAPSRILPVEFVAPDAGAAQATAPASYGGFHIRAENPAAKRLVQEHVFRLSKVVASPDYGSVCILGQALNLAPNFPPA